MKSKNEYCVIVGAQHNYTDSEAVAIDWYNAEAQAWIDNGKTGPKPEILVRPLDTITAWKNY